MPHKNASPSVAPRASKEAPTAAARQVGFRFAADLLKRVDAHADRLTDHLHFTVTRADAVRILIATGLQIVEKRNANIDPPPGAIKQPE